MSDGGERKAKGDAPDRRAAKKALREIGFSSRQVDALFRAGWGALVGQKDAELAELEDAVEALSARLGQKGRKVVKFPRSSQDSAEPTQTESEGPSALDDEIRHGAAGGFARAQEVLAEASPTAQREDFS